MRCIALWRESLLIQMEKGQLAVTSMAAAPNNEKKKNESAAG